jgi:glycosyltransferase involved in cell wall biosynthesis
MSSAPRALIISTWFPPVNAPGARRPYQLARHLVQRGWKVSVLTSTPEWHTTAYGDLDGMRILRAPRTAASADLEGWQRRLLRLAHRPGTGPANGPLRVLADLLLPFRHGLRWDLAPEAIERELGPQDIVVATSPDPTVFNIGARLARRWNATWAPDYRDPWNLAIPETGKDIITHQGTGLSGALRRWRYRRLERSFCGHAHLLTAVSRSFLANAMAVTGAPNGAVVFGGFDAERRPGPRIAEERFVLCHTGQLYPEQPWADLLHGLRDLSQQHPALSGKLRLRFVGAASTDPGVMRLLEDAARANPSIELVPEVGPEAAIAHQHAADMLLQLALRGRKGYLPVKFLEYLGARRPILLYSWEQDEMEEAVATTHTGTIVRDRAALTAHLLSALHAHRPGTVAPELPDDPALQQYDYARNMSRWAELLLAARPV